MILMKHASLLTAILAFAFAPTLHAEEPTGNDQVPVVSFSDLGLQHDGKEVTVILKITDTQLIAGDREGQYPHVKLHYAGMKKPPYLQVYAKGDLADILHRFACVAPDDRFVGRSIKATGKIKIYKDFPKGVDQTPVYELYLRGWKKFQILPEREGE